MRLTLRAVRRYLESIFVGGGVSVTRLITFLSILVAGFVLFCGTAAFADSDPHIIIGDPPCTASDCMHENSETFNFTLPSTQGSTFTGVLTFENDTADTWYSLYLTESTVPWQDVQCTVDAFFNFCQAVPLSGDPSETVIEFLNILPNPGTGILAGNGFTLDFEPVAGVAWPSNTSFGAYANTTNVPEPGVAGLLLAELLVFAGMLGFAGRNRFLKALS